MPVNIKKDPAVIEHVEAQVAKAQVAAAKAERTRVLAIIKTHADANKEEENKVVKNTVTNTLKSLVNAIKDTGSAS